ncbi:MAG: nucleotide exchange factor GrpE [Oscillospiraceae bacterium]|jgi:molecular chaperone GrpE|nr:nucleotide exchange factor GrpE [Oscillospiraceae bacterium]
MNQKQKHKEAKDSKEQVGNKNTDNEKLEVQLQELAHKHCELNDQLLRLAAEYENFRKRSIKEKDQMYSDATAMVVSQFLNIIDSVEAALLINTTDTAFKKGLELIYVNCHNTLDKLRVEEFGKVGDQFNPNLHNAVLHVETDGPEEGEIIEVMQKGYKIEQKIIRHATVKVAN